MKTVARSAVVLTVIMSLAACNLFEPAPVPEKPFSEKVADRVLGDLQDAKVRSLEPGNQSRALTVDKSLLIRGALKEIAASGKTGSKDLGEVLPLVLKGAVKEYGAAGNKDLTQAGLLTKAMAVESAAAIKDFKDNIPAGADKGKLVAGITENISADLVSSLGIDKKEAAKLVSDVSENLSFAAIEELAGLIVASEFLDDISAELVDTLGDVGLSTDDPLFKSLVSESQADLSAAIKSTGATGADAEALFKMIADAKLDALKAEVLEDGLSEELLKELTISALSSLDTGDLGLDLSDDLSELLTDIGLDELDAELDAILSNQAPTAVFTTDPAYDAETKTLEIVGGGYVVLDASKSTDPENKDLELLWLVEGPEGDELTDNGDGTAFFTLPNETGTWFISLAVFDEYGESDTKTVIIKNTKDVQTYEAITDLTVTGLTEIDIDTGTFPQKVTYTAAVANPSTDAVTYKWTVDGKVVQVSSSVTYDFPAPAVYKADGWKIKVEASAKGSGTVLTKEVILRTIATKALMKAVDALGEGDVLEALTQLNIAYTNPDVSTDTKEQVKAYYAVLNLLNVVTAPEMLELTRDRLKVTGYPDTIEKVFSSEWFTERYVLMTDYFDSATLENGYQVPGYRDYMEILLPKVEIPAILEENGPDMPEDDAAWVGMALVYNLAMSSPDGLDEILDNVKRISLGATFDTAVDLINSLADDVVIELPEEIAPPDPVTGEPGDLFIGKAEMLALVSALHTLEAGFDLLSSYKWTYPVDDVVEIALGNANATSTDLSVQLAKSLPHPFETGLLDPADDAADQLSAAKVAALSAIDAVAEGIDLLAVRTAENLFSLPLIDPWRPAQYKEFLARLSASVADPAVALIMPVDKAPDTWSYDPVTGQPKLVPGEDYPSLGEEAFSQAPWPKDPFAAGVYGNSKYISFYPGVFFKQGQFSLDNMFEMNIKGTPVLYANIEKDSGYGYWTSDGYRQVGSTLETGKRWAQSDNGVHFKFNPEFLFSFTPITDADKAKMSGAYTEVQPYGSLTLMQIWFDQPITSDGDGDFIVNIR